MSSSYPRALIAFDQATLPVATLTSAHWQSRLLPLSARSAPLLEVADLDLFVLLVESSTGISQAMIETWQFVQERQFPRLLLVQGIESSSTDFDDIVLIGNRVLEKFATPYLVLHDESGAPIGLIDVRTTQTFDYSTEYVNEGAADEELTNLIQEFREEYFEDFGEIGPEGWSNGIYPVALPIASTGKLGVTEVNLILATLATP